MDLDHRGGHESAVFVERDRSVVVRAHDDSYGADPTAPELGGEGFDELASRAATPRRGYDGDREQLGRRKIARLEKEYRVRSMM